MNLFIKITGIKGQLSVTSFMKLGIFFWNFVTFFFHPQGDLFSWPFCRLHQQKKSQNSQFLFVWKENILLFRNTLAGPVHLVKLAWKSRSQYLFEEKKTFGPFICDTLRSWLHEASAVILTLSPGLEKS